MRDASGNVLVLYEGKANGLNATPETIVLKETIIYGSSRIGQYRGFKNDAAQGEFNKKTALGQRIYEFSNHLGNVLVTLTDHKIPQTEGGYKSFVLSASDYYPFGMAMTERTYQNGEYRFGFNGQEHDEETGTDHYTYRQADPKIGRFWSLDPLAPKYPHNSPYAFSENQVIRFVELEGLEKARPEEFQVAEAQLDYYQNQLDNGNIKDETLIEGLSLSQLITDLRNDVQNPNSATCQNLGFYCGKASLQNVSINYNPIGYVSFVLDLALEGKAKFGGRGHTTRLAEELEKTGLNFGSDWRARGKPTNSSGQIFGKSLNSSTSNKSLIRRFVNLFSDEIRNEGRTKGNTIPYEMRRMMRYVNLKPSKKRIYANFNSGDIEAMSEAISQGFLPIIFDNHGLSGQHGPDEGKNGKYGIHFIVMQEIVTENGQVIYDFVDYGEVTSNRQRSEEEFTSGTRAYWIPVKRRLKRK